MNWSEKRNQYEYYTGFILKQEGISVEYKSPASNRTEEGGTGLGWEWGYKQFQNRFPQVSKFEQVPMLYPVMNRPTEWQTELYSNTTENITFPQTMCAVCNREKQINTRDLWPLQ